MSYIVFHTCNHSYVPLHTCAIYIYTYSTHTPYIHTLHIDGFRKIRSDIYQNPNYWEFKNPYFKRGDIDSISKIKKSAHFDHNTTTNNTHNNSDTYTTNNEVNELKSHVYQLDQKVSHLDMIIDELSYTVSGIQMSTQTTNNANSNAYSTNTNNTYSNVIDVYHEDDHKKRKVSDTTSNITQPYTNTTYNNTKNTTTGHNSDLEEDVLLDISFWDDLEGLIASDGITTNTNTTANTTLPPLAPATLTYTPTTTTLTPPVTYTHPITPTNTTPTTTTTPPISNNMDIVFDTYITNTEVKDITSILSLLPSHLQERFVDKLATSLGQKLSTQLLPTYTTPTSTAPVAATTATYPTLNLPQSYTHTMPAINNTPLLTTSSSNNNTSMLMDTNSTYASAALGALFTSCHLANVTATSQNAVAGQHIHTNNTNNAICCNYCTTGN